MLEKIFMWCSEYEKIINKLLLTHYVLAIIGGIIGLILLYALPNKPVDIQESTTEAIETATKETTEELITTAVTTSVVETEPPKVIYFDVPLSKDLQDHIFELCASYEIEPEVVIAVIKRESEFKSNKMGDNGNSYGLMQVQPRWHQARMDSLFCPDLLDPYQNVTVGIDYLAELFDTGNSLEWVLMAYNGGPSYANKKVAAGIVSDYAKTVIGYINKFKKGW